MTLTVTDLRNDEAHLLAQTLHELANLIALRDAECGDALDPKVFDFITRNIPNVRIG